MGGSYPCNETLSFSLVSAMLVICIPYSNERRARRLPACRTDIAGFTIPHLDVTSREDNCQVGCVLPMLHAMGRRSWIPGSSCPSRGGVRTLLPDVPHVRGTRR